MNTIKSNKNLIDSNKNKILVDERSITISGAPSGLSTRGLSTLAHIPQTHITNRITNILQLPEDMVFESFGFLNLSELHAIQTICKPFHSIIQGIFTRLGKIQKITTILNLPKPSWVDLYFASRYNHGLMHPTHPIYLASRNNPNLLHPTHPVNRMLQFRVKDLLDLKSEVCSKRLPLLILGHEFSLRQIEINATAFKNELSASIVRYLNLFKAVLPYCCFLVVGCATIFSLAYKFNAQFYPSEKLYSSFLSVLQSSCSSSLDALCELIATCPSYKTLTSILSIIYGIVGISIAIRLAIHPNIGPQLSQRPFYFGMWIGFGASSLLVLLLNSVGLSLEEVLNVVN